MVADKNPETLKTNKEALYRFFEKTKGEYRAETQARIEKVKRAVEY